MKLFRKRTQAQWVAFCERCGSVCEADCRATAYREQALDGLIAGRFGLR